MSKSSLALWGTKSSIFGSLLKTQNKVQPKQMCSAWVVVKQLPQLDINHDKHNFSSSAVF